jgi:hypothetical protein
LATFFSKVKLKDKKIAILCCHGGMKGRTLENMRDALKNNRISEDIDFVEPTREREKNIKKALTWSKSLKF